MKTTMRRLKSVAMSLGLVTAVFGCAQLEPHGRRPLQVVDNRAALRALEPDESSAYLVKGADWPGDGGGGFYWYDSASTEADDRGSVIQPKAHDVGRFKRLF